MENLKEWWQTFKRNRKYSRRNPIIFSSQFHPKQSKASFLSRELVANSLSKVTVSLLLVAGILVALVLVIGDYGILSRHRQKERISQLHQENKVLESRQKILKEKVYALRVDEDYMGYVVRKKLGFVRKDELIYQIKASTMSGVMLSSEDDPSYK